MARTRAFRILTQDDNWKLDGLCAQVDYQIFYPEPGDGSAARQAKSVCARCNVREICLEKALTVPEPFGVWGGTTEQERKRIRRENKLLATA